MNPNPFPTAPSQPGAPRPWLWPLAALGLLAVAGTWTHHAVREGLDQSLGAGLQSILDGSVTALGVWVENEKEDVRVWAADDRVRARTAELVREATADSDAGPRLRASPLQSALQAHLAAAVADVDYRGFALVAPDGLVLASDQVDRYVGRRVSASMGPEIDRVLTGQTVFLRPTPKDVLVAEETGEGRPVIVVAAPVLDAGGSPLAALAFTIDPEKDFSRILSSGRAGGSGDTYAFDRNGFLLSESRHEDRFQQLGLLPPGPEARSVLAVRVGDPGVDLTRGHGPAIPEGERPLTRMAASAVAGESGVDLSGYRDYRGVTVIGAWRWLPEYGFGVATEVAQVEAQQALRPLGVAFWSLLALLGLAVALLLLSSRSVARLRRRVERLTQLGQYTLIEKVGEGGMGEVFKARHALMRRPTAIKLIRGDRAGPEDLERFEREVQLTGELTHPNTISVFDYGRTPEGVFYYVMEYLPGLDLAQLVQLQDPVPPARVAHILRQVCDSLAEAHARGLVHRDIKPQNAILCERGGLFDVVKVLDFGLVAETVPGRETAAGAPVPILGTPDYIAPERLRGEVAVDPRSDLYSVGALGFFLLTGQPVFPAPTSAEACYRAVHEPAPRPSERTSQPIPTALDDLILECLAKRAEERPPGAGELARRLQAVHAEPPWTPEAARGWWQENRSRIESVRKGSRAGTRPSGPCGVTIAFDGSSPAPGPDTSPSD